MYYVAIIVILFLLTIYYMQETSKTCDYVLKIPNRNIIRQWLPTAESMKDGDQDPLNDRVNDHYMKNPYAYLKKEGLSDITSGLWSATTSHPSKSNDGRTVDEPHMLTDMTTPESRNQIAAKTHELAQISAHSSRMESFQMEGPYKEHDWSQ